MKQTTSEASTKPQNQQQVSAQKGHMERPFKSRKSPTAGHATKEGEIKKGVRLVDDPKTKRMRVIFAEKPKQEVRSTLLKLGFLWDPFHRLWRRFSNPRILIWLKDYLKTIQWEKQ